MSEEEWLTPKDVTDKMFGGELPIQKTVELARRLREHGFVATHQFAMSACLAIRSDYCLQVLDAIGYKPTGPLIIELNTWHDYEDDGDEERLMIQLIDRCPVRSPKLPPSVIDFVISRGFALKGAIAAMGALSSRRSAAKDVSRIIGRVIWSTRRFYIKK